MSASRACRFIIRISQMTFQKGQSYFLLKYKLERTRRRDSLAHKSHQTGTAGSSVPLTVVLILSLEIEILVEQTGSVLKFLEPAA